MQRLATALLLITPLAHAGGYCDETYNPANCASIRTPMEAQFKPSRSNNWGRSVNFGKLAAQAAIYKSGVDGKHYFRTDVSPASFRQGQRWLCLDGAERTESLTTKNVNAHIVRYGDAGCLARVAIEERFFATLPTPLKQKYMTLSPTDRSAAMDVMPEETAKFIEQTGSAIHYDPYQDTRRDLHSNLKHNWSPDS